VRSLVTTHIPNPSHRYAPTTRRNSLPLFRYAKQKHLDTELTQIGKAVLAEALSTLAEEASSAPVRRPDVHVRVTFQHVEITGFISFGNQTETYSFVKQEDSGLEGRGLVIVDGHVRLAEGQGVEEADGAEAPVRSNGAGKTTLVMAALWA